MKLLVAMAFSAGLLAALPAQAQMESREGIALQNQILELRRDIQALRSDGGHGSSSSGSMLGGRSSPPPVTTNGTNEISTQLLERVDRLEDSIRQLNGRVDELANTGQRQNADLAKQLSDLQFRLDNGAAAPAPAGAPGANSAPRPSLPPSTSPPPSPLGTMPANALPPAAPPVAAHTPELALQEGNAALARRDYPTAEARAREVLAAAKSSARGYDAQFLLAQALGGEKNHLDAALAFGETYSRNKQGTHAQDSLLGLANAQLGLGDKHSACVALDTLRAQFPTPRTDIIPRVTALRTSAGCH